MHKVLETNMSVDLLHWISIGIIYTSRGKAFFNHCKRCWRLTWPFTNWSAKKKCVCETQMPLQPWFPYTGQDKVSTSYVLTPPISRCHLLIKDYLPSKFEAFTAKCSRVISCTKCARPTDSCKAICPSFFKGGIRNVGYDWEVFTCITSNAHVKYESCTSNGSKGMHGKGQISFEKSIKGIDHWLW